MSSTNRPKVAFIGTVGTMASLDVLTADNLNPQRARLLLALTRTSDPAGIARIFPTY